MIDDPLLEISGIHPPMKNKVISTLVGNVLGINNDLIMRNFLKCGNLQLREEKL